MLRKKLLQAVETLEETPFPKMVIVEICGVCNLRCIMCPYSQLKREKGRMEWSTYTKIVDEIAEKSSGTQLWLAIMGEPLLLETDLYNFIAYAKRKGIKEVILNTNGTLLTPQIYRELAVAKLDMIIIGLDAATGGTYSRIRAGGNYEKVKRNMLEILKLDGPKTVLQFIVMNENATELEEFKDFWLQRGAILKVRKKLAWGNTIKVEDLDTPSTSHERTPCPWLMRTMSIHWSGKVAQCDGDYEGIFSPGNVNYQSIEEIWQGELKKKRDMHWNHRFDYPPCNVCMDWQAGLSDWYYPCKIENATISDLPEITRLWKAFIMDDTTQEKIESMQKDQRGRRDRVLICRVDNEIIGFIAYNIKEGAGHVAGIAIMPGFREKRYGTLLLERMERDLSGHGYDRITLEVREDNSEAVGFYKASGYDIIDKQKGYYRDIDAFIFRKIKEGTQSQQ